MATYFPTNTVPRDGQRTPEDWLVLLLGRLDRQTELANVYENFYNGLHPLQFATSKFREAFGNLFAAMADNWCQLIVDAAVERLKVVGFQVGGKTSTDAWAIWQDNSLDAESVVAHTEAGKTGCAYLLVDPNGGEPRVTVEHAGQMIVACDPGDRRKRLAALKKWGGDDGYEYVTLYLPDVVLRYETAEPTTGPGSNPRAELVEREMGGNTLGVVPVVPLANKPGLVGTIGRETELIGGGHSDLEPAIPLQNAVNKLCSDLLIASEYGAYPQRVITGWKPPTDEHGNTLMNPVDATLNRWLTIEKPDSKLWEIKAADLTNYVNAIEMLITHLAAQTRTPPHYLLAKMVNTSGDALQVAEAGLVSKCRAKALFFSDAWEEALALALTAAGSDAAAADCEAVWANPERISPAVMTDSAVKKKALGIPLPVIWLELGYTPEQIAEMEQLEKTAREEELAAAATAAGAAERVSVAAQAPPQPGGQVLPQPGQTPAPQQQQPPPPPG